MEIKSMEEFESVVLKSKEPILVDFFAVWCGPCRALTPIINEIEMDGIIKTVKVDIDNVREAAIKLQIMSVPTLIIFANGKPLDMMVGFRPKEELIAWIERAKKSIKR
jgi:thioredoxin 1